MRKLLENSDLGLLFARLGVGSVLFVHGLGKLLGVGPAAFPAPEFAMMLSGMGLPVAIGFAYLVTFVEVLGGLGLVLGVLTRYFSIMAAIDMFAAMVLVHMSSGFAVSNGGYEFVLVMAMVALGLVFTGSGNYSVEEKFLDGEIWLEDYL